MKEKIREKRILVVGDIIVDRYYYGDVNRISPEAPVPVFFKGGEKIVAGGAANVSVNLMYAGQKVILASVVGKDKLGYKIKNILEKKGCNCDYIVYSETRRTSVKTRLIAQNNQQLIRVDEEDVDLLQLHEEEILLDGIKKVIFDVDAILISDYMKGVLTSSLCRKVIDIAKARNIPVMIDIKDTNLEKYKDATLLKPNRKELAEVTGMSVKTQKDVLNAARFLREICNSQYVLATLGSEGMLLIGEKLTEWIPSFEHEVYDVSGAGDTVIAYVMSGFINNFDILEAAYIANCAAGIKVTKLGTSPVALDEVEKVYGSKEHNNTYGKSYKVVSLASLIKLIKKRKNKRIVFTNGCFDIIHFGHVGYLRKASSLGDILIVGLNSDSSVKRLKGKDRPINCQMERAEVLSAFEFVDYVVIFDEDTPIQLIQEIMPDVLVKGADYKKEEIIGREIVEKNGGRVEVLPFLEGRSTTGIVKKLER